MHIPVIVVVIVGLALIYLLTRNQARAQADFSRPEARGSDVPVAGNRPLAFVSRGKLFYCAPGEPQREIHSAHVQAVEDRLERSRELHAWKEGTSFGIRAMRRGAQGGDCEEAPLQMRSAHFAGGGKLLYFLADDRMGGLFEHDLASGRELRLVHRANLMLEDLRVSPDGKRLLCAQHSRKGTANIAVMDLDGNNYHELTGGDTLDVAPAWVPGKPDFVVLQSSGIARSESGFPVDRGPSSIQLLDAAKGALSPVADDPRYDYLQPRVAPDGSLLYIRRPYEGQRPRNGDALMDALLFPFRLLRALLHYLNFFSLMYTRKPLTSASGPPFEADIKDMLVKGKRIDAEAALRRGALVDGVPSLVPASWQLVRRSESGAENVLAKHVASYDVAPDGAIFYTNGYGVFALDAGTPRAVLRDRLIGDLVLGDVR